MLDQSFSAENLKKILDLENRKGLYLEQSFFPEVAIISKKIKQNRNYIKEKKKELNDIEYSNLCKMVDELKMEREAKILEELTKVSEKIISKNFNIELKKVEIQDEKPLYTVTKAPEVFLSFKQVQKNISDLYKVKQADRFSIVKQVKLLLNDRFPKYVLRLDIQNFYESIPHAMLLEKIEKSNLLTFLSKKIIRGILREYENKAGVKIGLPRGIGISAYLSELYMRRIDEKIKSINTITYYARYVDDIFIIFTPNSSNDCVEYDTLVRDLIETNSGLTVNAAKTERIDLRRTYAPRFVDFLGYRFFFGESGKDVMVRLTDNKIKKYKDRIATTFETYNNEKSFNSKSARRTLLKRINYLTGNTRLLNNKSNVLVGIYFSHSLLSGLEDLLLLDSELTAKIESEIAFPDLQERLKKFSFKDGFVKRRFSRFNHKELSEILEIWK